MELLFNELSIMPAADKYAAAHTMKLLADAVNEARKKGFRH
jgi:hypothetical protein